LVNQGKVRLRALWLALLGIAIRCATPEVGIQLSFLRIVLEVSEFLDKVKQVLLTLVLFSESGKTLDVVTFEASLKNMIEQLQENQRDLVALSIMCQLNSCSVSYTGREISFATIMSPIAR